MRLAHIEIFLHLGENLCRCLLDGIANDAVIVAEERLHAVTSWHEPHAENVAVVSHLI